jgi:cytidine deaminase
MYMPALAPLESVDYRDYCDPAFFDQIELRMVAAARRAAREKAVSYRNFLVGACGAILLRNRDEVVFVPGANNSPRRGVPRDCAEMDIVRHAEELLAAHGAGNVAVLDVYVAGTDDPEQIEAVTGLVTPTLHPCSDCRDLMVKHPAVQDDTGIVTVGLDPASTAWEQHSLRGLIDRYAGLEPPPASQQLATPLPVAWPSH